MGEFDARLERRLKTAGLLLAPLFALAVVAVNPGGHPPAGRCLLGIITLAVGYWMTEAIPLPATALLASALAIVTGVAPVRDVLAPYADPVIFLFLGSFLLAEALRKYGLDRQLAHRIIGTRQDSDAGLQTKVGLAAAAVSTCLSNTATAALMTPIALGAVGGRPAVSGVLLVVAYGASIGGMATLIGTPPNLLVAGFVERMTGVRVGFAAWLGFGVPIAVVLLALSLLWTRLTARADAGAAGADSPTGADSSGGVADEAQGTMLPENERRWGTRWTVLAFLLAGTLWMAPALVGLVIGIDSPVARGVTAHLPEAGVALLCATLLFVLPVSWRRRRMTLNWNEGRRVNWGILVLFGGGLSLGTMAEAAGLARWAGEGIRQSGLADTPAGLLAVAIALAIVVSEFASNTAAATLLVPVVIATAQAAGFDPVRPALGVGLAATCGFIFPVSTPPNAIVFGTGRLPLRHMIRTGALLDVTAFFVLWLGLLALTPVLPR